jgi:hypothetical protein
VGALKGRLRGAVAVLEDADTHHREPREPDHPSPWPAQDGPVGLPDPVHTAVRIGDFPIGSRGHLRYC